MGKPYHEMTPSERLADRARKNRALEERLAERGRGVLRDVNISFAGRELVGFSHADTFPVIASVIRALCGTKNDFVGHREIVLALVKDAELERLLDQIISKDPDKRTKQWWANCMMSWFSQTFTEGKNPYADTFDRDPNATPYRYRIRKLE